MELRTVDSVFDVEKYLEINQDVKNAIERGEIGGAEEHYYKYGMGEGREVFWKVIGKDRSYQCDVILIDGLVDVMGQYWVLKGQELLDVHVYIVSDDKGKFDIPQDTNKVTFLNLVGGTSPHNLVHYLIPNLKADFIIFSVPYLMHDSNYIRSQINRLQNSGREILIRVGFDRGNLVIIRKNTFLDMGGFRDTSYFYLEDLIKRAKLEERPFDHGELLRSAAADFPSGDTKSLRNCAIGYKQSRVSADVVIPFYGKVSFVEEAIRSTVDQDNADVIVHVIDDCSREDTSSFLRKWRSHKNVRVYRNKTNIGQFMSVNNIVPFLETEHIAFLDGDDLSVSNRICEGVNLLNLTKSDLFGSRIKIFGDEYEWTPEHVFQKLWIKRKVRHWNCTYPHEIGYHYFPNTSLIMTKRSFVEIGGFTDFGDIDKNKTANDTEFLYRYFFSGRGTCYSVSSLVNVRRHVDSCTQNEETGWATPSRVWVSREVERRRKIFFESRKFISKSFGSLGSSEWEECTQIWKG